MTAKNAAAKKTADETPAVPTQLTTERDEKGDLQLVGETDNRSLLEKATSFVQDNKSTFVSVAATVATCMLYKVVKARYADMQAQDDAFENEGSEETPAA